MCCRAVNTKNLYTLCFLLTENLRLRQVKCFCIGILTPSPDAMPYLPKRRLSRVGTVPLVRQQRHGRLTTSRGLFERSVSATDILPNYNAVSPCGSDGVYLRRENTVSICSTLPVPHLSITFTDTGTASSPQWATVPRAFIMTRSSPLRLSRRLQNT